LDKGYEKTFLILLNVPDDCTEAFGNIKVSTSSLKFFITSCKA